jgi:hypothetical protein
MRSGDMAKAFNHLVDQPVAQGLDAVSLFSSRRTA